MATQTITSDNFPCLSITYDDVTGNVTTVSLNAAHASVTKFSTGLALDANRSEVVESAFFSELIAQATGKMTALNSPIAIDTAGTIYDNQGIIDRDSGTTDANGNPITEQQTFKKTSLIQFFKFDPAMLFNPANAVSNND